jgi:ubiquitin-like 1-activating enzyme E1 A
MINLRGISTEACKNIVLAGVGSITILDPNDVSPEDLGAGFFFREEDIGQKVHTQSYSYILLCFFF